MEHNNMLKFRHDDDDMGDIFICPFCDHDYLHHGGIIIFDRHGDSSNADGFKISVHKAILIEYNQRGNPSRRRHAIRIGFWCENCDTNFAMDIAQHKGQTFFDVYETNGVT